MSKTISIYDAKTNLSKLIALAKQGEEVVIGSYGKPEVKLVAYENKVFNIGALDHLGVEIDDDALDSADSELAESFLESISKGLDE